jgi:hypothetical protein
MADEKKTAPAEAGSVEETIEKAKDIEAGSDAPPAIVQSVTENAPREGDQTPMPNKLETEPAAPVSTQVPDEPIAQTLAAGAGEHTPPDPQVFDKEGRPFEVTGEEPPK